MGINLIRKIVFLLFTFMMYANTTHAQTKIYSEADLVAIAGNLEGSYILANDIILTQEWEPIGKNSPFRGVLDGNNYAIRNLKINDPQGNYIGLFSKTENAIIKNLGIENAEIIAGTSDTTGYFVGIMIGFATNTTIACCHITNSRVEGRTCVGSFAGRINGNNRSRIIDSYSTAQVGGNADKVGGIFGSAQNTSVINVYYSGEAEAKSGNTGGIIGISLGGDTIANCLVSSPSLKGTTVGRIVGKEEGGSILRNNYARSDLLIKNASGTGSALPVSESFIRGKQGENVPFALSPCTPEFPHYAETDIDKAYDAFNKYYLSSSKNIYVAKPGNSSVAAIWTQAIFFDIAMNAYKRTRSETHKALIDRLYKGNYNEYAQFDWTVDRYPNGWFIFDDIMWWVISLARLHEITGDESYLNLSVSGFDRVWFGANGKRGSYDSTDGGMYWNWTDGDKGKMACINYPTVIAAMTLYNSTGEEEYFRKAKEIYDWAKKNLFDINRGRVADSNHGSGPHWKMHTYNQATCIGAAMMLYNETGDREYLEEAVIAANYLKNQMSTNGLLPFETGIEQGIYNAILAQYIIRLIEDGEQYQYIPWLHYNIDNAWGFRDKDSDITDMNHSRQAPAASEIESYEASGIPALMQVISPEIDPGKEIHCKSKTFFEKNLGWDMENTWNLSGNDLFLSKSEEITLKITKKYLNFPVSHEEERGRMIFRTEGRPDLSVVIRLAPEKADYWVFKDVSELKGKTLKITYTGNSKGLTQIYQDDVIAGQDSLYEETNRPQFHFTTRRGWINDPNGLIYYDGEYHLFYQHNPYEREWENMHWGHAVSKDLIHWKELPDALFPDHLGTMYSGSAIIDYDNTAGYNKKDAPAMIAAYTAAGHEKQVQCIAYSLDRGRTFAKYPGNPVIDSKNKWNSQDTRDPKVFWYEPNREWVMVLNERDGHSIYTSPDLKNWKYESHITGFWECPELFELPVDGNPDNKKWVMYGASGTYMIGSFDGKKFTPKAGKYYYTSGSIYAAQTFTNIPDSDGRRIQIGWGRISHPGMPFNGMMLLPTELSLRTTKDGIRLFSKPVKEIDRLQTELIQTNTIQANEANKLLHPYSNSDGLRIQFTLKLSHATDAGFNLYGRELLRYDMNYNRINGVFYSPEDRTSMEITADIIIDKTSVEVFIDNGAYSYSMERGAHPDNTEGFHFWGNSIEIKNLKVYSMASIWE